MTSKPVRGLKLVLLLRCLESHGTAEGENMSKSISALLGAISVSLLATFFAPASFAAPTTVLCVSPLLEVTTGADGTAPRVTINCSGGSSAPGIPYFAFQISTNPAVAALLQQVIGPFLLLRGVTAQLQIVTDLSDTSGNAWGCSAANCRVIYALYGD